MRTSFQLAITLSDYPCFRINPIFANDVSLASFDVEHVSPPRLAHNYISYICQREQLKISSVKLFLTTTRAPPEEVKDQNKVINMTRSDRLCGRDLNRPLLLVVEWGGELPGRRFPAPMTLNKLRERNLDSDLAHGESLRLGIRSITNTSRRLFRVL